MQRILVSANRIATLVNLSVRSVFKVLRLDCSRGKAGQNVRNGLEHIIMGFSEHVDTFNRTTPTVDMVGSRFCGQSEVHQQTGTSVRVHAHPHPQPPSPANPYPSRPQPPHSHTLTTPASQHPTHPHPLTHTNTPSPTTLTRSPPYPNTVTTLSHARFKLNP